MSTLQSEVPTKAANDVACPDCASTGPFEVIAYSIYSAPGRANRIAVGGDVEWDDEPVNWDYCDIAEEIQITCEACGEWFEVRNCTW